MQQAKVDTVKNLADTISDKFYDQRITHVQGWGSFKSINQIEVKLANGGRETITAKNIIIATGSKANGLPPKQNLPFDEKYVVSSHGALEQTKVPKRLTIYGGGIVGLEIGSVYQRLGSEVTVLQRSGRVGQFLDEEIGDHFIRILEEQGIKVLTDHEIIDGENNGEDGVLLNIRRDGTDKFQIETDVLLLSIGRSPNTDGLDCEKAGIVLNPRGMIESNDTW